MNHESIQPVSANHHGGGCDPPSGGADPQVEERVAEEFREVTRDLRAWEEIVERRAAPGGVPHTP